MKQKFKIAVLWIFKLCGLFMLARFFTRRGFMIVGWHGVSFDDEHKRLPEYFVSAETLRGRLAILRKYFRIVSLEEAIGQHERGVIQPNQVVLTFDDGMYNFAARALPILKEFHAPATVYVVSNTLARRTLASMLLIQDTVHRTKLGESPGELCGVKGPRKLADRSARMECIRLVQERFLELPDEPAAHERFLEALAEGLQVNVNGELAGDVWRYLSADEVRKLSDAGVSMQLHTHTHRDVVHYPETVYEEAKTCRDMLEEVTQKPAVEYCYPSGYWEQRAWGPLQKAGVRSAVTCRAGPNFRGTPKLASRRHIDTECMSEIEFEFALCGLQWICYVLGHPTRLLRPVETT